MQTNPNNKTAFAYDILRTNFKNDEITKQEVHLIKLFIKRNDLILDIGCGTGRHIKPLAKDGYRIEGIDSSKSMLNEFLYKKYWVKYADFFKTKLKENTYSLVVLFWNTFNELCLSKTKAMQFFSKVKLSLKPLGKILINTDNPDLINFKKLNFKHSVSYKRKTYEQIWEVIKYYKKSNISVSRETVIVRKMGKVIKKAESLIKQRWWTKKEMDFFANKFGFKIKLLEIKSSEELYFLLTKLD